MHPCPCCGYKTLPERDAYDLCPVCWWEDEGLEPYEVSGPNAKTLVEAQQEFLAHRLPYRLRPGKVRAPKRHEARDPAWRPFELTEDLARRVDEANAEWNRSWRDDQARMAEEVYEPEGPLGEYNSAVRALAASAAPLPHHEVKERLGRLVEADGLPLSLAQLELLARLMKDDGYYRRHPVHAAWWLVRYSRPGTLSRRWRELRAGAIYLAG